MVVALLPRYGGLLVAAWLAGIIVNPLLLPGHFDVALRDVGLLVGALALSRLAVAHGVQVAGSRPSTSPARHGPDLQQTLAGSADARSLVARPTGA